MTVMAEPTSRYPHQLVLVLATGKRQQPVQFSFNDTSFAFKDSSRSACLCYSITLSHFPTHSHPIDSPDVHVPLSHVLSVGISDSVVEAHVLEKSHSVLKLVKLSGSLQGDNAEASSAANEWVQGAMNAAYSGAWGFTHIAYHK